MAHTDNNEAADDCEYYIHIQGPDEIEPMSSEAEATKRAEALNQFFSELNDSDPNSPKLKATVGFRRAS